MKKFEHTGTVKSCDYLQRNTDVYFFSIIISVASVLKIYEDRTSKLFQLRNHKMKGALSYAFLRSLKQTTYKMNGFLFI